MLVQVRAVNLYGLSVSRTDFAICTGLRVYDAILKDIYDFLQIHTYNHSTLYIRTVVSWQYNREHENKLSVSQQVVFCLLLYMGVLQRDPMPKLCFIMVLTSCKDFLQIVRIFCHDLTYMSCHRLTPLDFKCGNLLDCG